MAEIKDCNGRCGATPPYAVCRSCLVFLNKLNGIEYVPFGPKPDSISHPSHYNQGKIEVIEFIEDKKLGFHLGNVVKYICRAGIKNPDKHIEDLEKAKWYLAREIERLKAEKENRKAVKPNDMKVD